MLNNFTKKSLRAFSIVEMIVSVGIILLVGGIFLANYRNNIRRSDLAMTVNILAADTRLAQSYSLGLMKYDNVFPDGGWGVSFEKDTNPDRYYFFADGYDAAADRMRQDSETQTQYKGRMIIFPDDIRIDSIRIKKDNVWQDVQRVAITFVPPRPTTSIYSSGSTEISGDEVIVTIVNTSDGSKMNLAVNFAGLIDVTQ